MGDGLACAGAAGNAHLLPRRGMPADRRIDGGEPALWRAPDESEIDALEAPVAAMRSELLRQAFMSLVGLGHHQEAGCVLVEAMNDARASDAADSGEA